MNKISLPVLASIFMFVILLMVSIASAVIATTHLQSDTLAALFVGTLLGFSGSAVISLIGMGLILLEVRRKFDEFYKSKNKNKSE